MKKSEIIKKLNEVKCNVVSYWKEGNNLWVSVKCLGGKDIADLYNNGFLVLIEGDGNKVKLEICGKIEWD